MSRIKKFIKTTLLGGIGILLPVLLTAFFLTWLFDIITGIISPITKVLVEQERFHQSFADGLVILIIIILCFIVGLVIKTQVGHFIHDTVEKRILKIMPGYTLFRSTIKQFLGQKKSPFSRVALVQPYGNSTLMTGFITDEHPSGYYTVFVPSALNPTTGFIFHIEKENVTLVDVSVEDTMRSIITCGSGSCKLLNQLKGAGEKGLLKECPHVV